MPRKGYQCIPFFDSSFHHLLKENAKIFCSVFFVTFAFITGLILLIYLWILSRVVEINL